MNFNQGSSASAAAASAAQPAAASPAEYEMSLYDGQGKLRRHGSSRAGRLHLVSPHLPRGLYGVVITQESVVTRRNLSLEEAVPAGR